MTNNASAQNRAKQGLVLAIFLLALTRVSSDDANFACDVVANPSLASFAFCNTKLSVEQRVQDLVKRLTLEEKIPLLGNTQPGVPRLGIPKMEWWSEALHGVSYVGPGTRFTPLVPGATSFPMVILTAASFNVSLFKEIGKVVSTEARAMYNVKLAGLTFWSPNINIYRDPRWGRAMETPGEDPLLVSLYGSAYVQGLQERDDGQKDKLKVAACCKHYTAYDVDSWNGVDRFHFNAIVTKQDMEDTYQPPFKHCVQTGNAASIMCSYNQVNGIPTCADPNLLAGIVRGQWKLNGYIVSDCDSVEVYFKYQNYTKTPEEAAAKALLAGLNLDCGAYLTQYTAGAVKAGLVPVSFIDTSVAYNMATLMRLGFFDGDPKNQLYGKLGPKDVCTPANQELAREAARQGIVLLKNDKGVLPLDPKKKGVVSVIGPNADVTHDMIGNYEGTPCKYTTPLEGIRTVMEVKFTPGCDNVFCAKVSLDDPKQDASTTDATIFVMGANRSIEEEGRDRTDITLPGQQQYLVTEVAKVSKGPVILVIMSGGGMDIQFAKDNPKISAILWVGYPGEAGGAAIADVIFGSYNPGGRLPMTWYPQVFVKHVPMTNMNMRADPAAKYPGRSYRFYTGPTVYSFGDGLSYTEFTYNLVKTPREVTVPLYKAQSCLPPKCYDIDLHNSKPTQFTVDLKVRNTGRVGGSHSVLLFVTPPPIHKSPQKQLVAFSKIFLAPQAETTVSLQVDVGRDLSLADELGNRRIALGRYEFTAGSVTFPITVRL